MRRTSSFRHENSPRYGPPKFRWLPRPWPSPTTMSAPASPGGRSSARATGSALTTSSAPRSWAIAAAWSRSSRQPKKFGYWIMTQRRLAGHRLPEGVEVGHALGPRHALHRQARARAVGLDHPPRQGRQRARDHDLLPLGHAVRHERRLRERRPAVVEGRVRDVHARQLADHRLVLVDRAQRPLARLRLVGRVRGEELAAEEQVVDRAGHVVVVGAPAEEGHEAVGVGVAVGEAAEVGDEVALRQRRGHRQVAPEPRLRRDPLDQRLQVPDPDRPQHLAPLRRRWWAGSASSHRAARLNALRRS